jgi:hypothetical protein
MARRSETRVWRALLTFLAFCASATALVAAPRSPSASEEFFIVSSVNPAKGTMVLKRPTEVTLTVRVTARTRCSREDGRPMQLSDLRAGDTVFIALVPESSGALVASTVRQGVMTLPELQRRYLKSPR